ncbi:MAG: hydrolase [Sedimentisphaerales bacterium]|nr:hydrolase [Sedimentisphaerales bacterium]MBN2841465.1 hydrolase [Sedimentisphaerales bacterium]
MKIQCDKALLLIVDVQDAFSKPVLNMDRVVHNCKILAQTAAILNLPTIVTEQYPRGLGHTIAELAESLNNHVIIEKTTFSCLGQPQVKESLTNSGRRQVIIAGVEAHVCVLQTALDLLQEQYEVFVIADAISSRKKKDRKLAQSRMIQSGAVITSTEAVVMELIGGSKHEHFKAIQALIK